MVHSVLDHDKWLVRRAAPSPRVRRMGSRFKPGVRRAIDECKPWVLDVESAILVDVLDFGWLMDIERLAANGAGVGNVDQARDQGTDVLWRATTSLQVSPSRFMH